LKKFVATLVTLFGVATGMVIYSGAAGAAPVAPVAHAQQAKRVACPMGLVYVCVYSANNETGTETTYALTFGQWNPTKEINSGQNPGSAINHAGHEVWFYDAQHGSYICTVAGQFQTLNHMYGWMQAPGSNKNNCTDSHPTPP